MARTSKSVTTEKIAAAIAAGLSFINLVEPVIPFWFRLLCALALIALVVDLCLRSSRVRGYLPSQIGRVLLSAVVAAIIVGLLWYPLRQQYAEDHAYPSIVFILGAPLGESTSPQWIMLEHHFGPTPAYNCDISFHDRDRESVEGGGSLDYPMFPPVGVAGDSTRNLHDNEADPGIGAGAKSFNWIPLYPDSQHYAIAISCRSGEFIEQWEVERINGLLTTSVGVRRVKRFTDRNPDQKDVVFACSDPEFKAKPLATQMPTSPPPKIPPPTLPPNRFPLPPVAFFGKDGLGVFGAFPWQYNSCWNFLEGHYGDLQLPLEIPSQPIALSVVIYGLLVLVFPVYCFLAFNVISFEKVKDEKGRVSRKRRS